MLYWYLVWPERLSDQTGKAIAARARLTVIQTNHHFKLATTTLCPQHLATVIVPDAWVGYLTKTLINGRSSLPPKCRNKKGKGPARANPHALDPCRSRKVFRFSVEKEGFPAGHDADAGQVAPASARQFHQWAGAVLMFLSK